MAVTKLWSRRSENGGHSAGSIISETIDYTCNPDKTKHITYTMVDEDFIDNNETISNVIKYVVNEDKTKLKESEYAKIEEILVSSINCRTKTADEEFLQVKEFWNKTDKNLLWHGVQSFEPGEIDPITAHEIGMRLAERMWGNKYQIIVTTHCDKSHIHNHFAFNSVSFIDGKKYNYSNSEIYRLRNESDKLCREYGLSVIENPKGKGMNYYEYLNGSNKKTVRGLIKEDIDLAILNSNTLMEVFAFLEKELGYEINLRRKYITLKPPGKEQTFRLDNLDKNRRNPNAINNYTEEAIVRRLHNKDMKPSSYNLHPSYKKYHTRVKNNCLDYADLLDKAFAGTSIRSIYWHYYYLLNNVNKNKTKYPNTHFKMRQEAQKRINNYSEHIKFFCRTKISSADELISYMENLNEEISLSKTKLSDLKFELRYADNIEQQNLIIIKISNLNQSIAKLRQEQKTCKDILSNEEKFKKQIAESENDKASQNERNDIKWQQKMLL